MGESSTFLKEILGERYEVLGKLGAGAFGEVYRARDTVLGREVAIKRIRLDVFAEPSQLEEVKSSFAKPRSPLSSGIRTSSSPTISSPRPRWECLDTGGSGD